MPNWNTNIITISHSEPTAIARLLEGAKEQGFMGYFYPCPKELLELDAPVQDQALAEQFQQKYGAQDWYDWSKGNWGVKWDFQLENVEVVKNEGYTSVTGTSETAWAPPIAFLQRLTEEGYSVSCMYYEPGMGFCGIWEDGCDEYYEYSGMNSEEVAEYLPAHLDQAFDISNSIAMWEEDQDTEETIEE